VLTIVDPKAKVSGSTSVACWLVLFVKVSVLNLMSATGGNVTVTAYGADLLGSATAVAVTVALTMLATLAGASYSTDVLACLLKAPGPLKVQVTPLPDESFATTAVMVTDWPCSMVCELPPLKLIEIGGGGVLAPPPHPAENIVHPGPDKIIAAQATRFRGPFFKGKAPLLCLIFSVLLPQAKKRGE